jgi:hypothetical protein
MCLDATWHPKPSPIFSEKKILFQIPFFWEKNHKNMNKLSQLPTMWKGASDLILSYFEYHRMQLNILMDYCHLSNIIKFLKRKLHQNDEFLLQNTLKKACSVHWKKDFWGIFFFLWQKRWCFWEIFPPFFEKKSVEKFLDLNLVSSSAIVPLRWLRYSKESWKKFTAHSTVLQIITISFWGFLTREVT